ncbi:hypothetical protein RBSWK_03168 [Rhodopirellula baltica SWK14]|uniref:Uncharacterized protein n=1 Tax=Rhodopirellula baltica SWK14 TaxID=993516 RepID=L7CGB9_RHOBT|nr:hypothetical protein RBSWK_03168 [Rhodopirellula baltica SWK14]
MDSPDEIFDRTLKWKRSGGVRLDVFVSDGISLGGLFGSQSHERMVAIAPSDWDCEDDVTFLTNREQVDELIERLRLASFSAFGDQA